MECIKCACCTFTSHDENQFMDVQIGEPDSQGMCESEKWCLDCILEGIPVEEEEEELN